MSQNKELKVLLVEDSELDAALITGTLETGGYLVKHQRVDTEDAMKTALDEKPWDIVISDFTMPKFRCLDALKLLKSKNSGIPFILVSGAIGEEVAVMVMKAGANDYIMKNNLQRLPSAVKREIEDSKIKSKYIELEKRYEKLVELSPDGIIVESEGKIVFVNRSGYELFGAKKSDDILGRYLSDLLENNSRLFYKELIVRVERGHKSSKQIEMQFVRLDGSIRDAELIIAPFLYEAKPAIQLVIRDITERKKAESLAYHDALTGLSNRPLFERFLTQEIEEAKRKHNKIAVFFIDLDNFKFINDHYGHDAGDKVLKEMAERLQAKMRKSDIVARIGGDELVIASPLPKSKQDVEKFAKRIQSIFHKKMKLYDKNIRVIASIGISIYPEDGQDYHTLLNAADIAMYRAKNNPDNDKTCFYSEVNREYPD